MGIEQVLINFARKEVGYKETPVNITKYNEWADENDYWFTKVQGCAWCTTFVAYCIEKSLNNFDWNLEDFCLDDNCCWSDKWMANFKNAGRFYNAPQIGDFAFRKGHIGIVTGFSKPGIITIEGNCDNEVKEVSHDMLYWLGYGRPRWEHLISFPSGYSESVSAEQFVINQGIYIGKADGEMHWGDNLTRGEMALILYRYWKKFNK